MFSLAEQVPECTSGCFLSDCSFMQFWLGLALGFVLGLLLLVLVMMLRCRKYHGKTIMVEDTNRGKFSITVPAISAFLKRILAEYPNLELHDMTLNDSRNNGLVMDITLKASQDTDLLNVRKELRDRIFAELESKLGIVDEISAINFEAIDFTDNNGISTSKKTV